MTEHADPFAPLGADELEAAPDLPDNDPWRPILPVPEDAPKLTTATLSAFAPPGYAFTAGWRYRDGEGRFLGCIIRYDRPANGVPADKQVRPVTFCEGPDGKRGWRCKGFPEPRPLYGLDRLAARPEAPVLVVEGEKVADAAGKLFPDHVVITSPGGSKAARKADWRPLAGRRVAIWPDCDAPGAAYGSDVAALAHAAGAVFAEVVTLPDDLPQKWDLADDLPAGMAWSLIEDALAAAMAGPAGPAPILSSLPAVLPFIPELLPAAIGGYVTDVADRQQAPPDFAAVTALCGLAAVVGNRVRIAPKQNDDWTVVPNLWGAIIGRPSAMKTPAMQSALSPVYAIQDRMREAWEAELRADAVDDTLSVFDAKDAKKRAEKALKDGDRDGARAILEAQAGDDEEEEKPCPRLIVNDATVEKLGELLNQNPRGLLLIRDELTGFLARMEREEFQGERAFYLEAFNGDGRFIYDRIGRGTVRIENCTLSLIGGVQPSRIAPIVRGAMSGASNDGLIQRLQLAVWPDDIGQWKWTDRHPDRDARERYQAAFDALAGSLPGTTEHPLVMRFSAAAQDLFRQWMEEIQSEARSGVLSSTMESHLLKMPATVASLALLFELIEGGRFEVGEDAIRRALGWADYLRSHASRLYASGNSVVEDGARLIVERRAQLPSPFTARDVHQKAWAGLSDRDAVSAAIDMLVGTNHCAEVEKPAASKGGRPTIAYAWHPSLGR